jgi:8-oxo-dGTP pyrophosphatase MutT (NUDIX family)
LPVAGSFQVGKIEVNETPKEYLARELTEELNIAVSVGKFCTEVTY